jgi:hypothetical protein
MKIFPGGETVQWKAIMGLVLFLVSIRIKESNRKLPNFVKFDLKEFKLNHKNLLGSNE